MGEAVGEGGLEGEEQVGPNLTSLETNPKRRRHERGKRLQSNKMSSNHCPSHYDLHLIVKFERVEVTHMHKETGFSHIQKPTVVYPPSPPLVNFPGELSLSCGHIKTLSNSKGISKTVTICAYL